jgi:hypothetical protein
MSCKYRFALLEFRSIIAAVRSLIKAKGMRLLDAFRAFDYTSRDGRLSCSELWGGLDWLGMRLVPEDIYAIMRHVDKTGVGWILFEQFDAAFRDEEEEHEHAASATQGAAANSGFIAVGGAEEDFAFAGASIIPKKIRELFAVDEKEDINRTEEIPPARLMSLQVSVVDVRDYQAVWTSRGTMARREASIWNAVHPSSFMTKRNRTRIHIGHYVAAGLGNAAKNSAPSSIKSRTLEIVDLATSTVFRSKMLEPARLNSIMPYPLNFKLIYGQQKGESTLYIWKAVPPTPAYVALGMMATTTQDPPPLNAMRCVPKAWCVPASRYPFKQIWDDSGTGGKKGSFWLMNTFGLLQVTEGHEKPEGEFWELSASPLMANEGLVQMIDGFSVAGGAGASSSSSNEPDYLSAPVSTSAPARGTVSGPSGKKPEVKENPKDLRREVKAAPAKQYGGLDGETPATARAAAAAATNAKKVDVIPTGFMTGTPAKVQRDPNPFMLGSTPTPAAVTTTTAPAPNPYIIGSTPTRASVSGAGAPVVTTVTPVRPTPSPSPTSTPIPQLIPTPTPVSSPPSITRATSTPAVNQPLTLASLAPLPQPTESAEAKARKAAEVLAAFGSPAPYVDTHLLIRYNPTIHPSIHTVIMVCC